MWSKDEYEVLYQKQIHVTAKDTCAILCALITLLYGFTATYRSFMRYQSFIYGLGEIYIRIYFCLLWYGSRVRAR